MKPAQQCGVCQVGKLEPKEVTYTIALSDHLVIVPGMPGSVCDLCGEIFADADITARVELLLGIKTGSLVAMEHPVQASGPMAYLVDLASTRRWSM